MAVIVTDTRIVINEADNTTGWNTGTAITTFFAEASACIAIGDYATPRPIFFTTTPRTATNTLIYVYVFNNGLQESWLNANPPVGLYIGDGTNAVVFKMAGDDKKVFVHSDGPTAWQNLVLDTSETAQMNTDGLTVTRAGTFANLNYAAITQFGSETYSLSKALGGGYNQACDIIRIGNNGLVITGGLTGDRGKILEIVIEDRSTANLKAHGIIREYSPGFYGLQGPLTFGSATETTWFSDQNTTLIFENRNIGNDKYYINVVGGTGTTDFTLYNSTITTAGPFVSCDFSSPNIDNLILNSVNFNNIGNNVTFGTDLPAQSHIVTLTNFNGCGEINAGLVQFNNIVISNTAAGLTGALVLDIGDATNITDLSIISGGGGHGIYITSPGDYILSRFSFSGYGLTDTTDAVIYNNSGGIVNIIINGGDDVPTYRNGVGSTTNIVVNVTLTLTQLPEDTLVTIVETLNRNNVLFQQAVGATGNIQFLYGLGEINLVVDILFINVNYDPNIGNLFDFMLPGQDATIPISLVIDRTYIRGD